MGERPHRAPPPTPSTCQVAAREAVPLGAMRWETCGSTEGQSNGTVPSRPGLAARFREPHSSAVVSPSLLMARTLVPHTPRHTGNMDVC